MTTIKCRHCKKEIDESVATCPHCGNPLDIEANSTRPAKNQTVAALFASLLGFFGLHKFYLGEKNKGIAYLLLSWTAVPALISLVDAYSIAFMPPQAWADEHNDGRLAEPVHIAVKTIAAFFSTAAVLAILGIIAAIAIPQFKKFQNKPGTKELQLSIRSIANTLTANSDSVKNTVKAIDELEAKPNDELTIDFHDGIVMLTPKNAELSEHAVQLVSHYNDDRLIWSCKTESRVVKPICTSLETGAK